MEVQKQIPPKTNAEFLELQGSFAATDKEMAVDRQKI